MIRYHQLKVSFNTHCRFTYLQRDNFNPGHPRFLLITVGLKNKKIRGDTLSCPREPLFCLYHISSLFKKQVVSSEVNQIAAFLIECTQIYIIHAVADSLSCEEKCILANSEVFTSTFFHFQLRLQDTLLTGLNMKKQGPDLQSITI